MICANFDRARSLNPEHAFYHDYRHALAFAPDFTRARIELSRY
jgi:hypothetical protein